MSGARPIQVRFACLAMGTRFEMVLWGNEKEHLLLAAEEVAREIQAIHAQLSAFDPASDIYRINERASQEPVPVDGRVLALLQRCRELTELTGGAFDIAVGSLMRRYGFRGPCPDAREADMTWGMRFVELDPERSTVRFTRPGIALDLGAVGKGYALDQAAELLRECRLGGALLHGGTSSVLAMGPDAAGMPWRVAVAHPDRPDEPLAVVELQDEALGVSAPHGRLGRPPESAGTEAVGHVMDPRSGKPASGARLAAVACRSALDADALSTALLVAGEELLSSCTSRGRRAWLLR